MSKIINYEEFEKRIGDFLASKEVELNLLDKIDFKGNTIFGYVYLAQLCEKTYKEGKNEQYQIIKKEFLKSLENIDDDSIMEEFGTILSSLKNTDVIDTLCNKILPLMLVEKIKSNKGKNVKLFLKYTEYYRGYFKNNMFYKLPNGRIFLEYLLEFDRDFVLSILSDEDKTNLQISQILRVKDSDYNYIFEKPYFFIEDDGYFQYLRKDITEDYYIPTKDEQNLLDEFDELFNDCGNARFIISRIRSFYIHQFAKKIPNALEDLKYLLSIKKANLSFEFIEKPEFSNDAELLNYVDGSFRISLTPFAACLDGMIAHEITHLFHHYCDSEEKTPKEFEKIKIRNKSNLDEVMIKIVTYLGPIYSKAGEKLKSVMEDVKKNSEFIEMVSIECKEFFDEYKRGIIREYYDKFDIELLDYVSAHLIFPKEYYEYIVNSRAKFIAEVKILKDGLFEVDSIIDLINAFYNGKVEELIKKMQRDYGLMADVHSEEYINSDYDVAFKEMLADYGTIIKSEKYEYYKKILIDIIGLEVVDFLENFYNNLSINNLNEIKRI